MAYTVFALKWRPKGFDEIVGQRHIVLTLKSQIQNNKLANAYLFAGPRGVGKTSTARILSKALNCKEGPTISPCQRCSSCIEISQARSLDVIEIDGASNRCIDDIRILRENVKFAPVNSRFKIYIIDEVHMLTSEAFNALLKTLEEPPEFVKFIFATTQPHKVLPTILSRCQRFDFRRISNMEIITQLEKIVKEENIEIDKDVFLAIAKSSDGSLRDAESVLEQLTCFSKGKISLREVISLLGLVEQEVLFQITDKIIHKDAQGALALFNTIIEEGKDAGLFLNHLIEHFRNLMIAKITHANTKLIDLPEEICQRLLEQSEALSLEEIFSTLNLLVNTYEMTKRLDSLRIPLEIALVKLSHDKKVNSYLNLPLKPKEHLEDKPVTPLKQIEKNPSLPNQPSSNITLEEIKNAWDEIIGNLSKIKMSVATYLNEGSPLHIHTNVLTISFPKNYLLHKESLERKENKAIVEKVFLDLFKTPIRINFILSKEIIERPQEKEEYPFIKSALETFRGRVVDEAKDK
ncbi:MAG: DNA polymerase III subunit gamma/tau [Candidatus Omnitrophica bacterium]|nr:DNA polymerase III subunit gamma/tau [Candidatus Omnitrophota bacterium]